MTSPQAVRPTLAGWRLDRHTIQDKAAMHKEKAQEAKKREADRFNARTNGRTGAAQLAAKAKPKNGDTRIFAASLEPCPPDCGVCRRHSIDVKGSPLTSPHHLYRQCLVSTEFFSTQTKQADVDGGSGSSSSSSSGSSGKSKKKAASKEGKSEEKEDDQEAKTEKKDKKDKRQDKHKEKKQEKKEKKEDKKEERKAEKKEEKKAEKKTEKKEEGKGAPEVEAAADGKTDGGTTGGTVGGARGGAVGKIESESAGGGAGKAEGATMESPDWVHTQLLPCFPGRRYAIKCVLDGSIHASSRCVFMDRCANGSVVITALRKLAHKRFADQGARPIDFYDGVLHTLNPTEDDVDTMVREHGIAIAMGFGSRNGWLYTIMPLSDGGDMQSSLSNFRSYRDLCSNFPTAEARAQALRERLDVMLQFVEACIPLHRMGYVLCDLKPGNTIMYKGRATHIDLEGTVRVMNAAVHDFVMHTTCTPLYAPPEYAKRKGGVTQRWDVWSAGVMFAEEVALMPLDDVRPQQTESGNAIKYIQDAFEFSIRALYGTEVSLEWITKYAAWSWLKVQCGDPAVTKSDTKDAKEAREAKGEKEAGGNFVARKPCSPMESLLRHDKRMFERLLALYGPKYAQLLTDLINGCLALESGDRLDIVQVANHEFWTVSNLMGVEVKPLREPLREAGETGGRLPPLPHRTDWMPLASTTPQTSSREKLAELRAEWRIPVKLASDEVLMAAHDSIFAHIPETAKVHGYEKKGVMDRVCSIISVLYMQGIDFSVTAIIRAMYGMSPVNRTSAVDFSVTRDQVLRRCLILQVMRCFAIFPAA